MITSTERHKLVSSRERGRRVLTADIDFRVVEECCAVITAPFLVEAAKAEDLSKCNKTDDAAIIHCASAAFVSTRAIANSKQSMGIIRRSLSKPSDVYSNLSLL